MCKHNEEIVVFYCITFVYFPTFVNKSFGLFRLLLAFHEKHILVCHDKTKCFS